ncbi:MAG: anaerobic ribonucleoside-triphosphate reductase activating protein [Lachnospiraceae bacterium]|nr:anaerobic ribonucleoside-triphosphate reductase activating protein [Lachnospiraceae bacterium]
MNYHNITYPDMLNGDGLRVVLWLSGCTHNCYKCQNPQTHNPSSGILFDEKAEEELFSELGKEYISGLTLTGGDPLHENNLDEVLNLVNKIRLLLPTKTIWLYSGYKFTDFFDVPIWRASEIKNNIKRKEIISMCDVMVDGKYIDKLRDVSLHWRGSSNQRVIDVKQTLQKGGIVLWAT